MITLIRVAPGTTFMVDDVYYTLVKTLDGGLNWCREDGKYALGQNFYTEDGMSDIEYLESMKKYLP